MYGVMEMDMANGLEKRGKRTLGMPERIQGRRDLKLDEQPQDAIRIKMEDFQIGLGGEDI